MGAVLYFIPASKDLKTNNTAFAERTSNHYPKIPVKRGASKNKREKVGNRNHSAEE